MPKAKNHSDQNVSFTGIGLIKAGESIEIEENQVYRLSRSPYVTIIEDEKRKEAPKKRTKKKAKSLSSPKLDDVS